jgi:hypothetical protein
MTAFLAFQHVVAPAGLSILLSLFMRVVRCAAGLGSYEFFHWGLNLHIDYDCGYPAFVV